MDIGNFVPLVAALALSVKFIDWVKYMRAKDANGVVSQAASWAGGVAVILLLAQTDFASGVEIAGEGLSNLNVWSQIFIGLSVGSTGSLAFDFKKAIDGTDSAVTPTLLK